MDFPSENESVSNERPFSGLVNANGLEICDDDGQCDGHRLVKVISPLNDPSKTNQSFKFKEVLHEKELRFFSQTNLK